ncbi:unnamed protein product [Dovyalis caffra]|uniref:DUF7046 domain-containing protein n=1 Tax=Dovyalis caffra TaxID=77055 RepID=A0AAV1R598_9ROSI|nr:unnamed protein product [Dovyalis caffra]
MFRDPVSNSEMDDPEAEGHNEREPPANWVSGNPPYSNTLDDPGSSYSPYLPPVLEEPSSSFSEAADDDPLPAIDGLQISGEAFPGRELQACGYSINGTTSCNFEWVRHLEDGSVNYIEGLFLNAFLVAGAKQPNYLVTADDVETYLAIEVQPLDDKRRKGCYVRVANAELMLLKFRLLVVQDSQSWLGKEGELVKVFANEHKKIRYDPEMHEHIQKTVYSGHVSYKVGLSTGFVDIWEPATLAIKREGYSIKCESGGVVITEKFSPIISVTIPYGHALEFILTDSTGRQHLLQADDSSTDIS